MNPFTNYLEKLGSNFLVSAMVPSLALVIVSILVFDPSLHIAAAIDHQRYKIHGRSITYQFSGTFTLGGTASNFIYCTHLWNPVDSLVAIDANGENAGTVEIIVGRAVTTNFEFQRHGGANWTLPQCKIRFNATYRMV
jgi:hypothetical protein